jgi:hypothetical protein
MPPQKIAGLQMQKLRQKQKEKQSQRPRLLHGGLEKAAADAKTVILDMVAMVSKKTPHSFNLCTHKVRYTRNRNYYLRSNRLRASVATHASGMIPSKPMLDHTILQPHSDIRGWNWRGYWNVATWPAQPHSR